MQGLPVGTVTFLFTDIEGSTPLWEKMSRVMRVSVSQHHAILRQVIEANGGQVFQILGDAFQAAFPTAEQALIAAVETQRALQTANWGDTGQLQVRMGLHAGHAEINPIPGPGGVVEYANSHTFNRAARVMSAGHGGQILLSQAVKDLVENSLPPSVSLRDLGEHLLKGMNIPEHLYQVEAPGLRADFPRLMSVVRRPNNLPSETTCFIGREAEIELIKQRLSTGTQRLVTLTGASGTGKTRLALQVSRAVPEFFFDGIWLVELAAITDSQLVYQTVAHSLAVQAVQGTQIQETLAGYLESKNLLLILDNCEHLIVECARVVDVLLHRCRRLAILATSRESINATGETSFRVPSLTLPPATPPEGTSRHSPWQLEGFEAVRLFVDRARLAVPNFILDDANAFSVATICRRLDGVPLAIELAAARLSELTVQEIATRLDTTFRSLSGSGRNILTRQQTLKNAMEWSYKLLTKRERLFLNRLSVFSGSCSLEAAESVCTGYAVELSEIEGLLSGLVDKWLVQSYQEEGSKQRFGMLEVVRQFAADKLNASGEADMISQQHTRYYLALAHKVRDEELNQGRAERLLKLVKDQNNFRAVLQWCWSTGDYQNGLQLATFLKQWSTTIGRSPVESQQWIERFQAANL
jgi:predicted ATPase/class 3 adenylate cyclase